MADWSDLWDGLNNTLSTGVDAYTKIATAQNAGKSEAQYYKGMNDALVYQQQRDAKSGEIQIGDMTISTSSILWIIGGTLGLLAIGAAVRKMM